MTGVQTCALPIFSQGELATAKSESKVVDNTFKVSVTVDKTESGGGGGGLATLKAFSDNFKAPTDLKLSIGDLGLPGTFGSNLGLGGSYSPPVVGSTVNLKVVFHP